MTPPSAPFRLRSDLVHAQIWSGGERIWVLKDPLTRTFTHFTQREHSMLSLADGRRTLSELCEQSERLFAPFHLTPRQVVCFFSEAKVNGLLVSDRGSPSSQSNSDRSSPWWANPLAIRLPGIDPTRFLDGAAPLTRPLGSTAALFAAAMMIVAAGIMVLTMFGELADDITTAASRFDNVIILLIVIATTKVIHELAHAVACRRLGGQCGEIGVMLLVGVPCLYCDVSDAWMIERARNRIFVSAAGMFAELVLAATATFVWIATIDGPIRDICVTVMVVCSISTLMFNGNPLLKYDGYYILSDLIGLPNLYSRSRSILVNAVHRLVDRSQTSQGFDPSETLPRRTFLIGYAVASELYRLFVYTMLLTIFYAWADSHGLGGLAIWLVAPLFGLAVWKAVKPLLFEAGRMPRRNLANFRRRTAILVGAFIAITMLAALPLPRTVVAPMISHPLNAENIVVSKAGFLRQASLDGDHVSPGEMVARLVDAQSESTELSLITRRNQLKTKLDTIRDRRGFDRDASASIPATTQSLIETKKQLELMRDERDRLQIRSKVEGVVYSPPMSTAWPGTPLDPQNRGCRLEGGTHVCVVGDAVEREAVLYLRQQDIELVRIGQRVTIRVSDRSRGRVTGRVIGLASSPASELPNSLVQAGWIKPSTIDSIATPYYPVRVRVDRQAVRLPVRLMASAQIEVEPASFWTRARRWASDSF